MKSVKTTIEKILSDIEVKLPPILIKKDLLEIDHYVIGFPVDPEKIYLCVRAAEGSDDTNIKLVFDIQVQLPGIEEVDAYDYIDAVNEYLNDFDPSIASFTDGSCQFLIKDDERNSTLQIYWSVTLMYPKDDCDD